MSDTEYDQVPRIPRLAYAVNMAVAFLEENAVHELPIDIKDIIRKIGWKVQTFSSIAKAEPYPYTIDEFCEKMHTNSGYSVPSKDCGYIIAYNDVTETGERNSFTLCHEVGHCYLRHFRDFDAEHLTKREMQVLDAEADAFAANILIPVTVFDALRNARRVENMYIFGVSHAAYGMRFRTINRDRDLLNEESRETLEEMFHDFIYGCKCTACGKLFSNEKHEDKCPSCGSTDVVWHHYVEYVERREDSEAQVRYKRKLQKFQPGALAHREERILHLVQDEQKEADEVKRHSIVETDRMRAELKNRKWDSLDEEDKIFLMEEQEMEEPTDGKRSKRTRVGGCRNNRIKAAGRNAKKAPDGKTDS